MRLLLVLAVVGAALAPPVWAAPAARTPILVPMGPELPTGKVPEPPPADPFAVPKGPVRVDWRTDLAAARKEAAAAGRCVLIYFHAIFHEDRAQPCHLMEDVTFANRGVAQYIEQNFIPVKVDDSKETSAVSRQYEVRLYPTVLFLSPDGEPLHMVLGPRTAPQLYAVLEKVQALPRLFEARRKAPDDLEANAALAAALAALDHFRRAEPYLKRVAELDPRNERGRLAWARLNLAIVPLEDGDAAQAMKDLAKFLDDFKDAPEVPTAVYAQGAILMQDGKLEEARRVFDDLRTRFPKHIKAYEADKAIDAIDARLKAARAADAAPRGAAKAAASPAESPAPSAKKQPGAAAAP
jgi:tetratricopeptide (TPR) repeat protein